MLIMPPMTTAITAAKTAPKTLKPKKTRTGPIRVFRMAQRICAKLLSFIRSKPTKIAVAEEIRAFAKIESDIKAIKEEASGISRILANG